MKTFTTKNLKKAHRILFAIRYHEERFKEGNTKPSDQASLGVHYKALMDLVRRQPQEFKFKTFASKMNNQ